MKNGTSVVACLGSSTTAGKGQAFDWIGELARRPRNDGIRFLNFGVGGDLAYNGLQRLPNVLVCHPDKVVVLLGGNDVLALVSRKVRRVFAVFKRLPREQTPEWFRENMRDVAHRLKNETSAGVALCSLPPIGEDPSSSDSFQRELNERVAEYSATIKAVAQEEGAVYVPFYERMREQIATDPGPALTSFRFFPFYRDAFRVLVLRKSPDEVGQINGWRFHTDGVHLNSRGGMILAELVQGFIDS